MAKINKKNKASEKLQNIESEKPANNSGGISFAQKYELKWIVPVLAVCILVFTNSLWGEFVYDDQRQIVRNPLIQDSSLIWKALTSDVWAFKWDGTVAASNYWRPTFTAWHILNFQLFGAAPFGWHVLNLLLHLGVCALIYALLRRWGISPALTCAITLIFAVHPVHVESVAWISGSPDPLFALAFLGSLWFAHNYAEKLQSKDLIISLLLYAVALGTKEIGILCFVFYYLIFSAASKENKKKSALNGKFLLYILVAGIYFVARIGVLGTFSRPAEDAPGPLEALLTLPAMFVFYLRQAFFPYWLSVNYSVSPVSQPGLMNFVIPVIISLAAIGAIFYLTRQNKLGKFAFLLFFLPLLPAMNAAMFPPLQLVHDRYLYLPLLGLLILIIPFAAKFFNEKYVLAASAGICIVLGFQTFTYNKAWNNELGLWEWSVKVDNSADSLSQYASELSERGKVDEAIHAYTQAIDAHPAYRSYLGRGRNFLLKGKYDEAKKDLDTVLQSPPEKLEAYTLYQTYEALAIGYSEQKKFSEAIEKLKEARNMLPMYSASLTANMAVILYQSGQKDEALKELESIRDRARTEFLPDSKAVFLRLGMLYKERSRKDDAKKALREYLSLTASLKDKATLQDRAEAEETLKSLN